MSNLLTDKVKQALIPEPEGTTLIITVGNTLRSDDGVGPFIASRLSRIKEGYQLMDVGDRPEDCLDEALATRPVKTVMIDAADFGGQPGEIRVIPRELIPETTLSTHTFPLPVIAALLEEDTGSRVLFIGIQPVRVTLGEGLSSPVRAAAGEIIQFLDKGEK